MSWQATGNMAITQRWRLVEPPSVDAWHRFWRLAHHVIARQRQRRALGELDERLLRDIGVSRAAARQESTKPIWQD